MHCQSLMESYVLDTNRCFDRPIWRRRRSPSITSQPHGKSFSGVSAAASRAKNWSVWIKPCSTNEPAFPWSTGLNVETAVLIADLNNTWMGVVEEDICALLHRNLWGFYANISGSTAPSCRERRVVTRDRANLCGRTGARPNQQG